MYIDPYFKGNVTPEQQYNYGLEQLRDESGARIWLKKDEFGNYNATTVTPTLAQVKSKEVKPQYASPRKLIPAGYDSSNPIPDPLESASEFPQFTVSEVINQFVIAFDDEGDVPRYKLLGPISSAPNAGEDVYDVDGTYELGGVSYGGESRIEVSPTQKSAQDRMTKGLKESVTTGWRNARIGPYLLVRSNFFSFMSITKLLPGSSTYVKILCLFCFLVKWFWLTLICFQEG